MLKELRREFGLIFLIPKNIYLPLSVFGIIFLIFLILDFDESLTYGSSFIASFITIFIISENTFKEDYAIGYIEQKLCENDNLVFYLLAKYLANLILVYVPMTLLAYLINGFSNEYLLELFFAYLIMLSTLSFFFNLGSAISIKRNNSLNALLIIPLLIPFIILVEEIFVAGKLIPNLNFLMAYFVFATSFINYAIIQILKIQSK
jgi:heme exporter protein CcmB|tara:strand:+ start:1772 stop:2386 length:615 start_codon:yes stop_codon:yes gene_type:complete